MSDISKSKTRRLSRLAALLIFASHGTIALAQTPSGSVPWDNSTTAAQLQAAIDQALIEKRIPGASVSIRQGDIRWTSNSGLADVATGTPPTADTYFGYRSITKSFVTTVIMQLAEEGRIGLDDPVGNYVDGVPGGEVMTIRQLAQMRSGLFNYTESSAFAAQFGVDPSKAWTARELLAFAFAEPLQFTPGASYQYSNSNTILLGEVIAAATGNDWSDEVSRRLTGPLGLTSVINQGAGLMPTPNAVGYIDVNDGTGPESLAAFNATGAGASGALVGVIADAERWGKAVGTGELLSKRDFVERLKSFGSTKPDPLSPEYDSYGFGMGEISGFIGHTGNGLGFEALVMYDRANDRTITILINASNPDDPDAPAHLFKQLLAILGWTPSGQIQVAADGANAVVEAGTVWTGLVSGPFGARAAVYAANGGSAVADGRVTLAPLQDYVPAIFIGSGGRVELGLGGDITASPGGDGAFLRAETGTASLVLTDVSIVLNGDEVSGTGVDARDNSQAMLNRVNITGSSLAGLHAGGDAPAAIGGVEVAVDLTSGDGVWVEPNGTVELTDSSIRLRGAGSGLHVTGGHGPAALFGMRLAVETQGAGSFGILAQGDGAAVALMDSSVITYGTDAHAIVLGEGARVDLNGTSVLAYGEAAAAVAAVSIEGASASRAAYLTVSDGTLAAVSGTAVVAAGTSLQFTASNSQVIGAITRSSDASLALALQNGSAWVLPAGGIAVSSRIDQLVNSNSTIAFAPPVGASPARFQSLTVGNYQGVNGTLVMNAAFAGAGAADRFVIDGGTATGHTSIIVQPLGTVALTSADGIGLIQAIHGGQTDPGAFSLGRRVALGAYEYGLYRGGASGADDWFLRSTQAGATGPGALPNLRPEVAVDTALPAIASQYSMAVLGTHAEREAARANPSGGHPSAGWARLFGETGSQGASGGTAATQLNRFLSNSPSYDIDLAGLQAGYDLLMSNPGEAIQNVIGFYVGAGQARGSVDAVYGGSAGKVSMDGYTLGAYWTHSQASGLTIDTVLQGTFFDASASSLAGETLDTDGLSLIASLEAGYRFDLGGGWAIEPQAQLVYQRLSFDDGADSFGSIDYDAAKDVLGRIGARVGRAWVLESGTKLTGSARASLWHAFGDGTEVVFADLAGTNPASFDSGPGGTWVQLGLDASMTISETVSLFASGDYEVRVDNAQGHAVGGRIGISVSW
ncbi:outer membrane autotransporter protein [Angulomicrobium tetraedrale]|uniref:Outer membrane autotransporter protein n=1 Tax=Ancylobacter tetraedralis TaxID=217068 RepID=A0A839ZFX6_9HYPH|nr:autotransporter outer membrane beta-barrel domain-containing protein [Ancylobacter tetraedralis]MBB3773771.1 outer membrane autotransporter protein [Ancylobacter tetraedralis]